MLIEAVGGSDMSDTSIDRAAGRVRDRSNNSGDGLHHHRIEGNLLRGSPAKAVGTFILVMTIIGTAIAATLAKPVAGAAYGSVAVPLAGGAALAVMAATLGHISGAHLNPAVTVGLAANRRFPWAYVPVYLIAQLAGAIGAALMAWVFFGGPARTVAHLGATYPAAGVGAWRAFAAEAVVTFVLVLAVVSVATDTRVPVGVAAIAIGAALASAILVSGPVSGGGVNPARSLGPMIVAGKFTDWWVYVTAPFAGGVLAAALYDRVLRAGATPTTRTGEVVKHTSRGLPDS
jgi:aquaporin Z/aquaporin NIP